MPNKGQFPGKSYRSTSWLKAYTAATFTLNRWCTWNCPKIHQWPQWIQAVKKTVLKQLLEWVFKILNRSKWKVRRSRELLKSFYILLHSLCTKTFQSFHRFLKSGHILGDLCETISLLKNYFQGFFLFFPPRSWWQLVSNDIHS